MRRRTHEPASVSIATTSANSGDNFLAIELKHVEPLSMSLGQQFELERQTRDLEDMEDIQELQEMAKQLLLAWQEEIARSRLAVNQITSSECQG